MDNIKKYDDFINEIINASYTQEWPMNKQEIGVNADDVANDPQYAKSENMFQQVQDHMKIILKPILMKKNKNVDDTDVEKVSNSFFSLGDNKNQEIKKMVDNCKDPKQTAQDIVNNYIKYVKINFNTKDNVNDVEQDSVMTSEKVDAGFNEVCPECDGKGYTDKGKCKICKGTGLFPNKRKKDMKIAKLENLKMYDDFVNEGKLSDVENFGNYISYKKETFPGLNIPKRYLGKGKYKYRVLARNADKVKPINFGDKTAKVKPVSVLSKKYWEALPQYR